MELTIFNTYVVMESQEQCDRMKQLCIDNNLPYWDCKCAFEILNCDKKPIFSYNMKEFFVLDFFDLRGADKQSNYTQVTEQEFINLLNKHNETSKTK